MSTFNATLAADLLAQDAAMFDGLVRPTLTPEQIADVEGILADRAIDAAVERVTKALTPGASPEEVRLLIGDATRMGEDVLALAKPNPGKADGREVDPWWTHAVTVATPYGSVKIQVRDNATVAAR